VKDVGRTARPSVTVARVGDDEFAFVHAHCPPEHAQELVAAVVARLAQMPGAPAVSAGVASVSAAATSWRSRELLAAAAADLRATRRRRQTTP
jgi:GGDEF domain-containing protein